MTELTAARVRVLKDPADGVKVTPDETVATKLLFEFLT